MKRSWLGTVFAALFACSPVVAAEKVVFAYTAVPTFLAAYVAADQGYFQKNGLDVEFTLVSNGGVIAQALVSGSVHIGGPTATVLLQANEGGLDLVAVAAAEKFPVPYKLGIIGKAGGPTSLSGLEGKKIGVPGLNGVIDVLTRKLIASSGGNPNRVTYVESAFPLMPDMLKSGAVDAVAAADPFFSRITSANIGAAIGDMTTIVPDGTVAALYASTRGWAKSNPSSVEAFRKSLAAAAAYIRDEANEAAVRTSLAKYTKLPPQVANTLVFSKNLEPQIKPDNLRFWIDVAVEQKMLSAPVDAGKLISP